MVCQVEKERPGHDRGPLAALQNFAARQDRVWHPGLLARQHWPGWTYESAKDDTAEIAVEPVDPVDLWGKFDPPTLPRGVAAAGDRGVRVRPGHDDGLRHGRHRGRRTGGLCRGDPG